MAIQNNFPSIKPSLLLDFANTKALDPRITFTRASSGRYYDGKTVAKAEENLLLRSQDYSATWTVTNLTPVTGKTAPDDTSTATEFTATAANAVLTQGFTAVAGDYTFSVFLRRVTGTGDIEIAADNGTWTTKVITSSWARYDVTQTVAAGSKTAGIRVVTDTDAIEVWGAQLEQRSAVTAYTPTTTQPITNYIPVLQAAANNIARFDHNPVTGESLGLLIEEQRANLLLRSEDFTVSPWDASLVGTSTRGNDKTAPGFMLGLITATSSGGGIRQSRSGLSSGQVYALSFYMQSSTTSVSVIFENGTSAFGATHSATINPTNGTASAISGFTSVSAQQLGSGYIYTLITAPAGGLLIANIEWRITNSGASILLGRPQLEAGAFPTSYIPTVASSVTRAADAASMTGANFSSWYRDDEGTLYGEMSQPVANTQMFPIGFLGGSTDQISVYFPASSSLGFYVVNAGVAQANMAGASNAVPPNVFGKAAGAYRSNDFALSVNGSATLTDTSGTIPVVDRMTLRTSGTQNIRKLAYYPSRLSNANLQALTS
jgi:hypothetical protein